MSVPDNAKAREARDIESRMARLIGTAKAARWMQRPVELLQGRTPQEAIAAGDYVAVSRLVGNLEEMPIS